jgi:GTPase
MIPVIAIVGRPNVGKSTLFNRVTRSRDALVADFAGLTRDRQYGEGKHEDKPFIVVDTGGLGEADGGVDDKLVAQAQLAIREADIILFLVDGRAGLTAADEEIAHQCRKLEKKTFVVVNKVDGCDERTVGTDFYSLGLGELSFIAASHGRGVSQLLDTVLADVEAVAPDDDEAEDKRKGIHLAIIGRPNVGKSTLVNRMLGEERVVVFDMPGTTRDSIHIPFERRGKEYTLIDTAGVRKRGRVKETVEKFSVIKTLQAIEEAHVVLFIVDAQEGLTDQDCHLLGFAIDAGRALVIAINKWDGLELEQRDRVKQELKRRLSFVDFAKQHFISALHGTGVGDLYASVNKAYEAAGRELKTSELTNILYKAVEAHQPPLVRGRRIKLRYAHGGGHYPPRIVIHGNQTKDLPNSYQRYLINFFREKLKLAGTAIHFVFKSSENPYAGKKNLLTPRQQRKRDRLMRHHKKK